MHLGNRIHICSLRHVSYELTDIFVIFFTAVSDRYKTVPLYIYIIIFVYLVTFSGIKVEIYSNYTEHLAVSLYHNESGAQLPDKHTIQ